ncbi:hypothetical protein HO133_002933 [Letharia lupina]|uniref:Uncharacterized protein n=1 Tax=Letharia lupina TaxID=560253 RepID=A0A8H6CBG6_9LECA|nr:uncharacterized protein HO133_002933 [Letharia lupina]KAF6220500.1 hypothetical protein HO133_002933 [Letharia lupina]
MPGRMRMIDAETLRDEIRENPKSTRWVSKRGVVRKKQGGGKGKGDAVDEGQARERCARDGYEREKHRREMSEIDALAWKMHAREMYEREKHQGEMSEIDALARKMHARDMYEREKHQREMSEIDAHARKMHARAMHDRQVHTQELYESEKREREKLESEKLERDLRAREIHAREMHDKQTLGRDYERHMNERDMPEMGEEKSPSPPTTVAVLTHTTTLTTKTTTISPTSLIAEPDHLVVVVVTMTMKTTRRCFSHPFVAYGLPILHFASQPTGTEDHMIRDFRPLTLNRRAYLPSLSDIRKTPQQEQPVWRNEWTSLALDVDPMTGAGRA